MLILWLVWANMAKILQNVCKTSGYNWHHEKAILALLGIRKVNIHGRWKKKIGTGTANDLADLGHSSVWILMFSVDYCAWIRYYCPLAFLHLHLAFSLQQTKLDTKDALILICNILHQIFVYVTIKRAHWMEHKFPLSLTTVRPIVSIYPSIHRQADLSFMKWIWCFNGCCPIY